MDAFTAKEQATIRYAATRCNVSPAEMANFAYSYSAGNEGKINGLIAAYRNAHRRYA